MNEQKYIILFSRGNGKGLGIIKKVLETLLICKYLNGEISSLDESCEEMIAFLEEEIKNGRLQNR